ncbi:MAG: four helix bundle protein [Candidatus Saccharimonadales bacterium]
MENSKLVHHNSYAQTFEELEVWKKSQDLAVEVYKATKLFPKDELYSITSQIRRAVGSISANIAEGFGRTGQKDRIHFMTIAYGSLLETKNFLYLSGRLGYISQSDLDTLIEHVVVCQKLLNSFKRSLHRD